MPLFRKPSVLVGMSGGVDSSVTAALLVKRGFRVTGGFIKNWSDTKDLMTGECSWRGDRRDAIRVAAQLGIPLLTFDFEEQYREKIVNELFRGYAAGETPNPDVLCNEYIKFGLFVDEAKRLGMDYVATGHYARVKRDWSGKAHLLRGKDPEKDQSYFLHRVPQDVLRRTLFPIGELKKPEVRRIAEKLNLSVATKPDSQGICFIGKLDMAEFLRKKIEPKPGNIVDEQGKVLGQHSGLDAFTIGQRHGFGISSGGEAWYVAAKNMETNTLLVVKGAEHPLLFRSEAMLHDLHWTRGVAPKAPFRCSVQVRYRQRPVGATLNLTLPSPSFDKAHDLSFYRRSLGEGSAGRQTSLLAKEGMREVVRQASLRFDIPVKAIAAGQSAVLYSGDECVGGGVLKTA